MSPRITALTNADAPEASRTLLEAVEKKLGKAPNLFRSLAHSPAALQAYLGLGETLSGGAFTAAEREVLALATAQVNDCGYCLAAHTTLGKMAGLTEEQTLNARGGDLEDPRLDALAKLTRSLVENRGFPGEAELQAFAAAGYGEAHLAEVVAGVAQNLFTNYFNHLAGTEIDFPAAPELQTA